MVTWLETILWADKQSTAVRLNHNKIFIFFRWLDSANPCKGTGDAVDMVREEANVDHLDPWKEGQLEHSLYVVEAVEAQRLTLTPLPHANGVQSSPSLCRQVVVGKQCVQL